MRNRHLDAVDDAFDLTAAQTFGLSLKLFDLFLDLLVRLRHGYLH